MCGIVGIVDYQNNVCENELEVMTKTLVHRGPDNCGTQIYNNSNFSVGFGHTRLSVIDISSSGHQPMNFKHLTIVYNGEIYNYKEIKKKLMSLGHHFVSETDTEVVLHAFHEWGIKCLKKFIGMFAFAIFDKKNNKIFLIKDRAGVKPLFYYFNNNIFMFSSELKTFHKSSKFNKQIDENSVKEYIKYGFIPSPNCIYKFCNKVDGATYLVFDLENKTKIIKKYWDVNKFYNLPILNIPYHEAKVELKNIIKSSYNYRMISDVPVGIFLSGGYDSVSIAAILQKQSSTKLKTFSIGFKNKNNEAIHAKKIANFLETDHTEYYCRADDVQQILYNLPEIYDEPFDDSSAIPTILVSKLAAQSVKVALSGDGGDEVFGGYNHYIKFRKILNVLNKTPKKLKNYLMKFIPFILKLQVSHNFRNKLNKILILLDKDKTILPSILYSIFYEIDIELKNNFIKNQTNSYSEIFKNELSNFNNDISLPMAYDYKFYLQNDILTKVDRATMSVSIEGREPLLDHRLIEFAAQLPSKFKINNNSQKFIFKDIVHEYVPEKLLQRPKSGFSIPLENWLRTDMKEFVNDNFSFKNLNHISLFNSDFIEKYKDDFYKNKHQNAALIWRLLQFNIWFKKWM